MKTHAPRYFGYLGAALAGALVAALALWPAPTTPAPEGAPGNGAAAAAPVQWTCSMHPQILMPGPGKCPLCFMDLIPLEAGGGDPGPRALSLSPAARALARVETAAVERRAAEVELRLAGKVAIDETRRALISARFPGRLERLFVDYAGVAVRRGDHLVQIYSPEAILAIDQLQDAVRRLAAGERDSGHYPAVLEPNLLNARERLRLWGFLPEQIAAFEKLDAVPEEVQINAPISGIVLERAVTQGQYVKTGDLIYSLADLSRVWVELSAYEADLPFLRYGQPAAVELSAWPGETIAGTVVFIDPLLDDVRRTVRVRLTVDNADGRLKPGLFVRATVRARVDGQGRARGPDLDGQWTCPMHPEALRDGPGECPACGMPLVPAEQVAQEEAGWAAGSGEAGTSLPLVIPATAPLLTGRRALVYVEKDAADGDDRVYEGREVALGPRAGDVYVVLEGLREGERVVSRGAFQIDSSLQIQGKTSMMNPPPPAPPPPARDPYFGPGEHDGAPEPGWYAAADRSPDDPRAAGVALDDWYAGYARVFAALVADDLPGATTAADTLAGLIDAGRELSTLAEFHHDAGIAAEAAHRLAAAGALADARLAFRDLSGALTALARRYGAPAGGLHLMFCPMAFDDVGAFWLQADAALSNPYFGPAMLRCGWEIETLDSR